jgi:hypothetical protein
MSVLPPAADMPVKGSFARTAVVRRSDAMERRHDKDNLKVFASQDAAETWLQENDPEGVAFEYEVLE